MIEERRRDYSLIGPSAEQAAAMGLVAAQWYHSEVPRKRMKQLMRRSDGPAVRDTALWLTLLVAAGVAGGLTWGGWWCVPCFLIYGVLYGSASDSRWHETGHGTAFATSWANDVVYQLASFMNLKEPTFWRWSHARHHTDTIIVGRDREIAAMRPPDVARLLLNLAGLRDVLDTAVSVARHAAGRVTAEEATFIPESERHRVYREARAWLAVYAAVIALAIITGSLLPLMYVGLPSLYGRWLATLFGVSQHAGLAENVLDHRLNARTIRMNPVFRFLYWNMNFHVEHHMFPMVPYHALPALHAEIAADLPEPYPSLLAAYREILPTLRRQMREPGHHVVRRLPAGARPFRPEMHDAVFSASPPAPAQAPDPALLPPRAPARASTDPASDAPARARAQA
ncbi:MAG TPA: fatty acid desaturase family protein [Solirubrobacteraceae bacterium]|nr:fatty acid desaturase family protein [Solirubrobacteraceae bacterium]